MPHDRPIPVAAVAWRRPALDHWRPGAVVLAALFAAACAGSVNRADDGARRATTADQEVAVFEGPIWRLVEVRTAAGRVEPAVARGALRLAGGRLTGTTGCNNVLGEYTRDPADASRLRIGATAASMMACDDPRMAQEQHVLGALDRVTRAEREGNRLRLRDDAGVTWLAFEEEVPAPLVGTAWRVTNYDNGRRAVVSVLTGTTLTARFAADGTLAGSAGCNSYRAGYTRTGDTLTITPPAATRRACQEPEGVMEQEAAFLAALPRTEVLEIEGDRMTLRTVSGALVAILVATTD